MHKLLLKPEAINDLESIYQFSFDTWGRVQAEKYQDELFDLMNNILENPEIGKLYYYKEGNYRNLHVNRHLIFYRIDEKYCIVVRILHERMELRNKLD